MSDADGFYRPRKFPDAMYTTDELQMRSALSASIKANLEAIAADTKCLTDLERRLVDFVSSLKLVREKAVVDLTALEQRLGNVLAALQGLKDEVTTQSEMTTQSEKKP